MTRNINPVGFLVSNGDLFTNSENGLEIDDAAIEAAHSSTKRKKIVSADDVRSVVEKLLPDLQVIVGDTQFTTADLQTIDEEAQKINTPQYDYNVGEDVCRHYCSAFYGLMALRAHIDSIGQVWDFKGHHAYNVIIYLNNTNDDLKATLWEPQTDQMVTPHTGHYDDQKGLVLI